MENVKTQKTGSKRVNCFKYAPDPLCHPHPPSVKTLPWTEVIASLPTHPHTSNPTLPLYHPQCWAYTKSSGGIMCCRCHPAYQHVGTGAEKSAGAFIHNNPSESDRGIFRPPSHGIWQAPVRWMDFPIHKHWNRSSMWEQKKRRKITEFFPSCLLLNPGWKHVIRLLWIFIYFFPPQCKMNIIIQ